MVNDLLTVPHLQWLKLVHPITDGGLFHIYLLIGDDHYWNIVEDDIIRAPGPTALKSKIGYLLPGRVPTTDHSTRVRASILHVMTSHKEDEPDLELSGIWHQASRGHW